jgi:hypothetical protein
MTGPSAGESLIVEPLLRNPGGFSAETPQIIQLGPAHPAPAYDLDSFDRRGVEGEDTLYTDSGRNLADHEGFSHTTTPPADADPFKGLDPLFFPFTDAVKNPDSIPWRKVGDVLTKLFLLELSQQIRHDSPQKVPMDRNK